MTSSDPQRRPFRRSPRREYSGVDYDHENIERELKMIQRRAQHVAASSREDFSDGTSVYDAASMAVIRLASLTERTEFGPWLESVTDKELAGIRATRNIVAHAGYTTMDDSIFWETVTERVPEIIDRLLKN